MKPVKNRSVSIFDVATLPTGQVNPKNLPYSEMILIAPDHIESGSGRVLAKVTAKDQGAISGKYLVKRGAVIYSKIRPYLRKAAVADGEMLCSADMYPFECSPELDPIYLLNVLLSKEFTDFAVARSARSGIPKINREELGKFRFTLPSMETQRQIVAKLSTWDRAIDLTNRRRALISKLFNGLGRRVFGNGESTPLKELLASKIEYGANASSVPFVPEVTPRYVRITDITSEGFLLTDGLVGIRPEEAKGYELEPNDVLVARSGNTVGKSYLHRDSSTCTAFAGYLLRIKVDKTKLSPHFLFYFLQSDAFRRWVKLKVRAGAQPNINAEEYGELLVPLMPLDEQLRSEKLLGAVEQSLFLLDQQLRLYRTQKVGIAQTLLFKGGAV